VSPAHLVPTIAPFPDLCLLTVWQTRAFKRFGRRCDAPERPEECTGGCLASRCSSHRARLGFGRPCGCLPRSVAVTLLSGGSRRRSSGHPKVPAFPATWIRQPEGCPPGGNLWVQAAGPLRPPDPWPGVRSRQAWLGCGKELPYGNLSHRRRTPGGSV